MLNSLAEEKLQASLRCLARHGRFLEIGKFDLSNNSNLGKMGHQETPLIRSSSAGQLSSLPRIYSCVWYDLVSDA